MTPDEFEKLLIEFSNAAAGSWRMNTMVAYNKASNDILAEYERLKDLVFLLQAETDKLQAEVERLKKQAYERGKFDGRMETLLEVSEQFRTYPEMVTLDCDPKEAEFPCQDYLSKEVDDENV